ncbi:hypothetical protein PybrP1_002401 [[Pythium] brassicae (nom. inval.)]|nr:hypothetical protein PybrP1_002401 [[Pythium] brassicae (nom. inval.)]
MGVDGEWQLVTRRAKQPKAKAKKAANAGFTYRDDGRRQRHEDDAGARRDAICERVARVAAALRNDDLLQHAVTAIASHWQLHSARGSESDASEGAAHCGDGESEVHVVSYGLGSFCAASNAVYQLAFARALQEALAAKAAVRVMEIFDPVMNETDVEIAAHFGFRTIERNECGKRAAVARTVFFMPHCGRTLYENVLASNWSAATLPDVVIVGNSFEAYSDRLISASERRVNVLVGVLPFVSETLLRTSLPKVHDEFTQYEAAFNDLSVHVFPPARALEALQNEALAAHVAAIADSKPKDSGELIAAAPAPAPASPAATARSRG